MPCRQQVAARGAVCVGLADALVDDDDDDDDGDDETVADLTADGAY
jgi:hypothetical protein